MPDPKQMLLWALDLPARLPSWALATMFLLGVVLIAMTLARIPGLRRRNGRELRNYVIRFVAGVILVCMPALGNRMTCSCALDAVDMKAATVF